jgi:hypothetical protein
MKLKLERVLLENSNRKEKNQTEASRAMPELGRTVTCCMLLGELLYHIKLPIRGGLAFCIANVHLVYITVSIPIGTLLDM